MIARDEPEYLHVVFRPQRGQPSLVALEPALTQRLCEEAVSCAIRVLALGGTEDHLHLALLLPARRRRRQVLERLKRASEPQVRWQRRHGVWRMSLEQLPYAISYILCQKEHHARGDLWPFWELGSPK